MTELLGPELLGNPSLVCPALIIGDFADYLLGAGNLELASVLRRTRRPLWRGTYPSRWQLTVPRFGIQVTVTPVIPNQELFTTVRYWEGAVDVQGSRDGRPIEGRGYVELTGYAE